MIKNTRSGNRAHGRDTYVTDAKDQKSKDKQNLSAALGVMVGENRYLIPMEEVSEVIPIPKLAQVPLTQPWFLGIANVRGNLLGISDLGVFLGDEATSFNLKSRILLITINHKILGGFVVNSMLGIRNMSEFVAAKTTKKKLPKNIIRLYKDGEGRLWRELSLLDLVQDKKFLQIEKC